MALELLNIFCCFHFEDLSEHMFEVVWMSYRKGDNKFQQHYAENHRLVDTLERMKFFSGFLSQPWDSLHFRGCLSKLAAHSLISYSRQSTDSRSIFSLHPLINSWGRDRMSKAEYTEWSTRAFVILAACPSRMEESAATHRLDKQSIKHMAACSRDVDYFLMNEHDLITRLESEHLCLKQYGKYG